MRLQNLMMFRLGFFGPFFVDSCVFLVQLCVFEAVYSNVDRIGTWGKGQMILYIGTFSMINAFNMVIYFFGINNIPDKIKNGDMDLYLTKPVSPLLRLTFERVNPGSVPLLFLSGVLIAYGIKEGGVKITPFLVLGYVFWIGIMTVLYYLVEVLIRSLSFFILTSGNAIILEEAGLTLCMQLPGIVFYGIYKVIFYMILPYGIMATLPVQFLTGEMTFTRAMWGVLVAADFALLTAFVWKQGIRHYNSASS
jgi:ABC-2 type transport system permease protein